ncbi:MAG: peptidase M61 [Bacteroidota bacterium]
MMKLLWKFLTAAIVLGASSPVLADGYAFSIDLNQVENDRLMVELITPKVDQATIEYQMPKVVPGTYSISDFGRFVHDLKAFDAAGNELTVSHPDANRWKVENATQLHRITYWVEDTWDTDQKGRIFEPGGTNIEAGKNFMINTFGFFGYLEGMKETPIKLTVRHPREFYGATALVATDDEDGVDVYEVENYHVLADSPLMYSKPNKASEQVGGAEVLVAVYSPNERVGAEAVMKELSAVLAAQKEYLGGQLPVKKYAFLIYLTPGIGGGMGALEHSNSSMYYMPESEEQAAAEMMVDVAAHEFFHIVTPLNIHSEEIHYFDYIDPKMSKHLWLYEGMTEYSAGLVQAKYDLIHKGAYLRMLQQKITMASLFNDTLPFTELSKKCLDETKSQYINVYQKGALIGLALDIQLRELSNGEMGIQELLRELSKTYGKNQPFKDEELFDKITELTYPEIREFFRRHVEGPTPLPYAEIFQKVGIKYEPFANRKILSFGKVDVNWDADAGYWTVSNASRANKFGKQLGYQDGDQIVSFDGEELTFDNFDAVLSRFRKRRKEKDKIVVEIRREQEDGSRKLVKAKAKAITANFRGVNRLSFDPNATPEQEKLREAWLEPQI